MTSFESYVNCENAGLSSKYKCERHDFVSFAQRKQNSRHCCFVGIVNFSWIVCWFLICKTWNFKKNLGGWKNGGRFKKNRIYAKQLCSTPQKPHYDVEIYSISFKNTRFMKNSDFSPLFVSFQAKEEQKIVWQTLRNEIERTRIDESSQRRCCFNIFWSSNNRSSTRICPRLWFPILQKNGYSQ